MRSSDVCKEIKTKEKNPMASITVLFLMLMSIKRVWARGTTHASGGSNASNFIENRGQMVALVTFFF